MEPRDTIVTRVSELAGRAESLADLEHHHIQLVAALRMRARGVSVPPALIAQERISAATALAAPALLSRVRAIASGPIVVMKGPEVARAYPAETMRCFRDIDVLVPNARGTQRELLAGGFEEFGDPALYEDIHHLRPVRHPSLPLVVEVHHSTKWVHRLTPPSTEDLLEAAVPAPYDVPGLLVLPPAHHALVLTAHAWAHRPLGKVGDLLDIALVAAEADERELSALANEWGLAGVWKTTRRAILALTGTGSNSLPLRVWARHLGNVRERTVLEAHLERWLSPFWSLPRGRLSASLEALRNDLVPGDGEDWPMKRARVRAALGNAFVKKSQHDGALDQERGLAPVAAAAPGEGTT